MSARNLSLIAASGSLLLLAAAFFFQSLGWAPCKMCLWQRWPHVGAIGLGVVVLIARPAMVLALLGVVAMIANAGIAAFHSGVELKWWDGPASCSGSGPGLSGLSGDDLLPTASDIPELVMCDTLQPFFLGLTMANWNMLASAALALVWLTAARAHNASRA